MAPDRLLTDRPDVEEIALRERTRRERHTFRLIVYAATAVVMVTFLLSAIQTLVLINFVRGENNRSQQSRSELQATSCHIEESIRRMARKFGATIPPSDQCLSGARGTTEP